MYAYEVHITGRVQGVGFRPFVHSLAKKYELNGSIENNGSGVHIHLFSEFKERIHNFYQYLIQNPPPLSIIRKHSLKEIEKKSHQGFYINESEKSEKIDLLLSPDFAICDQCRNDLFEIGNNRFHYPFITCTKCGPRFSIIKRLPYDREHTCMDAFIMCNRCHSEYENIKDRRYYSQTNSCPECPVNLSIYSNSGIKLDLNQLEIISLCKKLIFEENKILAIKGIGGYLLMANSCNPTVVQELRKRKNRKFKPFALMYSTIQAIEKDLHLTSAEKMQLCSPASPIVLVKLKKQVYHPLAVNDIAPGLDKLGIMIPYSGLYALILENAPGPVIATSGNISKSPIIYNDSKAMDYLAEIADFIITNDRDIILPQDDSVVQYSRTHQKGIILRRSRGLAPSFETLFFDHPASILAFGAELKASFSILHEKEIYSSQYLGNLGSFDSEEAFSHTLNTMINVLNAQPERVIVDLHPDYSVTRLGLEFALEYGLNVERVQHHEAHFAAVIAENHLHLQRDKILGVIWDGTGYGTDGEIWGGEFFSYENSKMKRINHLEYFPHIGGDQMAKYGRIPLKSILHDYPECEGFLSSKFHSQEWRIYDQLVQNPHKSSSSMGRVFDAIACMLDICEVNDYEGMGAMLLEKRAREYIDEKGLAGTYSGLVSTGLLDIKNLVYRIFCDFQQTKDVGYCAAKFHESLVELIRGVAEKEGSKNLAFSGGVFQNALLVDLIIGHLKEEYNLYFHKELSPNDENISFGQIAHVLYVKEKKGEKKEFVQLD